MKIKDISKESRPRERLIEKGVNALSNNELLAILLRTGSKNESAIEMANRILSRYNIKKISNLDYLDLIDIPGIKESKATLLLAAFELSKRAFSEKNKNLQFDEPKNIYNYMMPLVSMSEVEMLYAIYVDCKLKKLETILIAKGTSYNLNFDIKQIISIALKNKAYGVILVHNHPSGDINPSKNDILSTKEAKKALDLMCILFLDHLIITEKGYFSFNEMGYL